MINDRDMEENPDFAKSFMHSDARKKRVNVLATKYQIPLKWADKLPVKIRKVTDCGCCLLFLIIVVCMFISSIFIIMRSESADLYKMYDSSGNDCGVGDAAAYPLLYMQSFGEPYKSVCVKSCPSFDYNQIRYNSTGQLNRPMHDGEDSSYSRS